MIVQSWIPIFQNSDITHNMSYMIVFDIEPSSMILTHIKYRRKSKCEALPPPQKKTRNRMKPKWMV